MRLRLTRISVEFAGISVLTIDQARLVVARLHGFDDWQALASDAAP
jgi:hypothetical protein